MNPVVVMLEAIGGICIGIALVLERLQTAILDGNFLIVARNVMDAWLRVSDPDIARFGEGLLCEIG